MSKTPTLEDMATWPPPNFVNPETRRPFVLGIEIPLMILVITFTTMRFYSRTILIKALGADDWFMLAATIVSVGCSVMTCVSMLPTFHTGYHLWDLPPDVLLNPVKPAQMAMATQLLFVPITAFTKISILLTYLRIFPSKMAKKFCYCMLVFTASWSISSFLAALLQCQPVQSYWLIAEYPNRKCIHIAPLYFITGGFNVLSDFLIFLFPAQDLARIRISLKQRVTLICMFTLGVVICIAGICRIWYTSVLINSYDALWNGATLYAIVAIETSIGIICGCLPACRPLLVKMAPHIFTSTHSSTNKTTQKKSKLGGQSFPFQSLSGGIVVSEEYSVEYGRSRDQDTKGTTAPTTIGTVHASKSGADAASADSEEWIMMQDNPRDLAGQRVKSGV